MISIGNEELDGQPFAVDLEDENGEFEIVHTNEDGTTEFCKVSSGTGSDGTKTWGIGGYTTKSGTTFLAVVGGRVLQDIILI